MRCATDAREGRSQASTEEAAAIAAASRDLLAGSRSPMTRARPGRSSQSTYAMSCSSAEDVPRGMGFLFDADCPTLEAMDLVDGVCRFVEMAELVAGAT